MRAPYLFCASLVLASCSVTPCRAQNKPPDSQIAKVFSDWEKRQTNVASIRYSVRGERLIMKGSITDDFGKWLEPPTPSNNISCPFKQSILFDFSTGRFRIEASEQCYSYRSKQYYPEVKNVAFNGTVVKYAYPREPNATSIISRSPNSPDVTIYSGNLRGFDFGIEILPFFFAHGIVRTVEQEITAGRFKQKLDSDYFHVHGTGLHLGCRCLVLRTQTLQLGTSSFEEFWVDQARESAIVRYVTYSGNKPFSDTTIDYRKTRQGWLLSGWTQSNYHKNRIQTQYRAKVEELTLDPGFTDAAFDIEIKPGMVIQDARFPDSDNPLYTPQPQKTLYREGEGIIEGGPIRGGLANWRYWFWLLVAAIPTSTLAVWFVCRRRKARV